ncbi:MAG TPA: polysaccharide biosynthesis protein [Bacteroidetes bacterium]|nr:polysaccharide biosynthesis protein [Bacteroidota bacterium]
MIKQYQQFENLLRQKALRMFMRYSLPRWLVFIFDNTAVFLMFVFAYFVRFNFASADIHLSGVIVHGAIASFVYLIFSILFRSYAGILRHTTLTDITLLFAVTTSSLTILIGISMVSRLLAWGYYLTVPISIILIHYVSITVFLFFSRIFVKMIFRFATMTRRITKKVLIYGAGEMGFVVKRVLLSDPLSAFNVIGFIDDNKKLQGKKINGLPVFSSEVLNTNFLYKHKINTLIIAIKNVKPGRKSEILRTAIDLGLEILETPAIDKWLGGQLNVQQLQNVKLEDLLGRDPIRLNLDLIRQGLNDKTILVTGAAGSIGSEIVRQLALFNIKKAVLIDYAETPMFHLDNELRQHFSHLQFDLILADITNAEKMELVFNQHRPEIVFHAAAYKHVPLMEANPHEAFRVNVGGTKLITDLSIKYGVKKFVMISSDKSVNPANIMGASKHLCEMLVQSRVQEKDKNTQFVITRFGNVLGSNGSVIPIFEKQIKDGGPVTVTHPEVTRYFMTIPEACELVLEAGFMGKGSEIYVFDMGDPVPIVDLAYQMIQLSGLVPERDIEVIFTGLRPGEKLFEELLTKEENTLPTHHPKIKIARVKKIDNMIFNEKVDKLLSDLYSLSKHEIVNFFEDMVPEYKNMNDKSN